MRSCLFKAIVVAGGAMATGGPILAAVVLVAIPAEGCSAPISCGCNYDMARDRYSIIDYNVPRDDMVISPDLVAIDGNFSPTDETSAGAFLHEGFDDGGANAA